jgi:hypothetical protein
VALIGGILRQGGGSAGTALELGGAAEGAFLVGRQAVQTMGADLGQDAVDFLLELALALLTAQGPAPPPTAAK